MPEDRNVFIKGNQHKAMSVPAAKALMYFLLGQFIVFLKKQKQLVTAEDLHPELRYTWMQSPDKINVGRVILWRGVPFLQEQEVDAQINVQVQDSIAGVTHTRIWHHEKGKPLLEGWREESESGGENGNGGNGDGGLEKTGQEDTGTGD